MDTAWTETASTPDTISKLAPNMTRTVSTEFHDGSVPGVCKKCDHYRCNVGEWRSGTCSGTTNAYACKVCDNIKCNPGFYRSGNCYWTLNKYTCTAQPKCQTNKYLVGASPTTKGECTKCSNVICTAGKLITHDNMALYLFFKTAPQNRDLRCVLWPSALRSTCRVKHVPNPE